MRNRHLASRRWSMREASELALQFAWRSVSVSAIQEAFLWQVRCSRTDTGEPELVLCRDVSHKWIPICFVSCVCVRQNGGQNRTILGQTHFEFVMKVLQVLCMYVLEDSSLLPRTSQHIGKLTTATFKFSSL